METGSSTEVTPEGGPGHPSHRRRRAWTSSPLIGVFLATSFLLLLYLVLDQAQRWRILRIPFNSTITDEPAGFSETPEGRVVFEDRVVSAKGFELPNYAIADIGDVRIAVERLMRLEVLVSRSSSSVRMVIDSNQPNVSFGGSSLSVSTWLGTGGGGWGEGLSFSYFRQDGVSKCRLNNIPFSVQRSLVAIADIQVPIGEGRKVVFLRNDGSLSKIVDLD